MLSKITDFLKMVDDFVWGLPLIIFPSSVEVL